MSISRNLNLVPEKQLIQYVQNPQLAAAANIPAASALFELQKRTEQSKELANLKARMASMQAPQTIAEKAIQEARAPGIGSIPTNMAPTPPEGISNLAQNENMPQGEPTQTMAEGGLAGLDTGDMYNEKHYANGGIIAFDGGGDVQHFAYGKDVKDKTNPEFYDPTYYKDSQAALVPTRPVPTLDDIIMQQSEADKAYGVDPNYFKTRMSEAEAANKEELDSAKRLSNANILFAMAEKLGTTPGSLLRGLTAAGPAGGKAAVEGMRDEAKIKQLQRLAQDKLKDAQYAQARGDSAAAQKHIEDYKNINTNLEIENAKLETTAGVSRTKNAASLAGKAAQVKSSIYGNALKDFANAFPNGAQETVFHGDPGFFQFVKNNYIKNSQDFIANDKMPVIPTATQLEDMYSQYKTANTKAAANPNAKPAADNTPAIKRPDYIQSIMNKYSDANQAISNQKSTIKNKNTPEELNTPWDLAGTNEDEDSQ